MTAPIQAQSPQVFKAPWPKSLAPTTCSKIAQVFWKVISIIIFPIFLTQAAFRWVRNRALRVIVPGNIQSDTPIASYFDLIKLILRFLYNPENFKADNTCEGLHQIQTHNGQSIQLQTPDGAFLDGAFYPGKNPKKAIIYAFGNGEQWENHTDTISWLKNFNTSILMFNPRGVGKSQGPRSEQGYILDAYSAYRYLIDKQHLDPEDVLLVGFSMGAAYGTCAVSLIQKDFPGKKINVINLCSFSNLHLEVQNVLRGWIGSILRIGACILNFDLNPKAAWDQLKGKKCLFYRANDDVIPHTASLCKAVTDNPIGKTRVVELIYPGHIPPYDEETNTLNNQILDLLNLDLKQTSLPQPWFKLFRQPPPTLKVKTITQAS